MLRPFNTASAVGYQTNLIDGAEVVPTVAKTQWVIQRCGVSMPKALWGTPMQATLYETLPIRCRIIRVTPKLQAGVTTAIDPTNDLFINQYGAKYGANDNAFTMSDAENAVVNWRVYTVLGDDKFTLGAAPVVWSYLNVDPNNTSNDNWSSIPSRPSGQIVARRNFHHQLAAKKNGAVRFVEPQSIATTNAETGHRREYIFIHCWYEGADGMTVAHPPGGDGSVGVIQDIRLHIRTVSKFKDV